jgi:asparagine synthase (glutamine-hydrolysing)
MGFPVPLFEWLKAPGEARAFARDVLSSSRAMGRELFDNRLAVEQLETEPRFGRKAWGLLCLELWQQTFHDRAAEFRNVADEAAEGTPACLAPQNPR